MKHIIISVINDLVTDQRVHRMASTLSRQGFDVKLVGRYLPGSLPVSGHDFRYRRFRMAFRKGPLFYACYNVRLFLYLLFGRRPDLLISVDLDTLPAGYMVSRLRRVPLLFDSHEYFTEVPELVGRERTKRFWEKIEGRILPRVAHAMAVSDSIAAAYHEKYGTPFVTVRNVPMTARTEQYPEFHESYHATYKIIYQGALNLGRGIGLMIEAMEWMQDTLLFIVGDGDIRKELQQFARQMKLNDRVVFLGKVPPDKLVQITGQCDLGLSLEEDLGLNYRYALPNKLFDYIQAGIPVLCSDLPEMAALVKRYRVGEISISREPRKLAAQVRGMLHDETARKQWKKNLAKAALELNWEREENKFLELVSTAMECKSGHYGDDRSETG